ncbi:hypothetical protein R3P38DRAFT_3512436 [Favolaschia claudopus]|uniref:Protein kinase domain-containing protein n=1 Tax=Favolaschia claudopus TaxID=2862362 RepID=A0AAW0BW18_9AGAR
MATERTTPPNSASAVDSVTESTHSTPFSGGSGSNMASTEHHYHDDYLPFLKQDVSKMQVISVEDFFSWILGKKLERNRFSDVIENPAFKGFLEKYIRAKPQIVARPTGASRLAETYLYHPFVEMANWYLKEMGYKNVVFCRNDPIIVLGSAGERKPDVLNVDPSLIKGDRINIDHLSEGGPVGDAFYWSDIPGYWEFKPDEISWTKAKTAGVLDDYRKSDRKKKNPKKRKGQPTTADTAHVSKKKSPQTSTQEASNSGALPESTGSSYLAPPSAPQSEEPLAVGGKWTAQDEKDLVQCASYGLEMLSNGGVRSHAIGVLVSFNWLELLYYDRSIIVKSQPFNFVEDNLAFFAVLSAFGNFTRAQWGYVGLLIPPQVSEKPANDNTKKGDYWRIMHKGHFLTALEDWTLELGDTLFRSHGLIGRGTVVAEAKVIKCPRDRVQLQDETVVVKWSWVPKTRTSEAGFVGTAREQATNNNPQMLDHLPEVYCSQDFDHFTPECQLLLHDNLGNDVYEKRVLRVMIQKKLTPITKIDDPKQLAEIYKQIFECYRWLYDKALIIHRDISISNFMYHEVDGKLYGVLNDFDLALRLGKKSESTSKQRTGTKPFMAKDLLVDEPPEHLYRHDLESFLYVLVFLTCKIENSPLEKWAELSINDLYDKKTTVILERPFPSCKNGFTGFDLWILNMRKMFRKGFTARNDHADEVKLAQINNTKPPAFNDTTLDDEVTFDKFAAAMAAFKSAEGEDAL